MTTAGDSARGLVLRRRWINRLLGLSFGIMASLLLPTPLVEGWTLFNTVAMLLGIGVMVVAIGSWRQRIEITEHEVKIRNTVRWWSVPLDDLMDVQPPAGYGPLTKSGLKLVLRDGRTIYASAFAPGPGSDEHFADQAVDALRAAAGLTRL